MPGTWLGPRQSLTGLSTGHPPPRVQAIWSLEPPGCPLNPHPGHTMPKMTLALPIHGILRHDTLRRKKYFRKRYSHLIFFLVHVHCPSFDILFCISFFSCLYSIDHYPEQTPSLVCTGVAPKSSRQRCSCFVVSVLASNWADGFATIRQVDVYDIQIPSPATIRTISPTSPLTDHGPCTAKLEYGRCRGAAFTRSYGLQTDLSARPWAASRPVNSGWPGRHTVNTRSRR